MGGYQQLIRGEPFVGKLRESFESPGPFVPSSLTASRSPCPTGTIPCRKGHRVLVQIQSFRFPRSDRNPQECMDLPGALASRLAQATRGVYRGGAAGFRWRRRVLPGAM